MHINPIAVLAATLTLGGCATATVHQEDLDAWVGRPVAELEKHPVFVVMPMVSTRASDGTEIRNYVNGQAFARCSGGGSANRPMMNLAQYNAFTNCTQGFRACNNIFYISNGTVTGFTPVGTGGARCQTDARLRPEFSKPTNL